MGKVNPRPTGELQGDDKPMPDRGVNSGVTDTYHSDLNKGYNSGGGIGGDTKSDTNRMPECDHI